MKRFSLTILLSLAVCIGFLFPTTVFSAPKIVIGHPACLSGTYAKAGEQALGGIKACVDWVNNVYGGVKVAGKKYQIKYKYYDCESKKESVTSLIGRLITADRVNIIFAPYSSGLTLRGAPVLAYVRAAEKANSLNTDKVRTALGELHFMSFYGGRDIGKYG
jgi:branched-chain amino acid transport system substrate-binding protein